MTQTKLSTEGQVTINPIFSKPLYSKFTNIDTKKIVSMIDEDGFHDDYNNTEPGVANMSFISNSIHVLDDNKFKFLKDILMKEFYLYASDVMGYTNEFEITTSWFTMSTKGQSSKFHNHSNCMMSGVLYLQTSENSGNIIFENFNNERYSLDIKEYNVFNSPRWSLKPEDGQLVMFPSEVHHKIAENKSDTTRYSLAFNLIPTGALGVGSPYDILFPDSVKIKVEK
jgi:uncharacterized protein (TIGR02466 family)